MLFRSKSSIDYIFENQKLAQGMKSSLIKMEAKEQGFFDSIVLNEKDEVCETSSANIFWIKLVRSTKLTMNAEIMIPEKG